MLRSVHGALHCNLQRKFVAEDDLCFSFDGAGETENGQNANQRLLMVESPSPYNSRGTSLKLRLFDSKISHSETLKS